MLLMVEGDRFSDVMLVIVLMNIVQLCMPFYTASPGYDSGMIIANYTFTAVFTIEVLIKMSAFGLKAYWVDRWHWFDFVVVLGGIPDCIFGEAFAVLGVFRAVRVFKVFKHRRFNHMFKAVLHSLGSVLWITVLSALLFYVYAIIGMVLFSRIPVADGDSEDAYDRAINFRWNFSSLPRSLFLLFRAMTGEKWQALMEATHVEDHELCDPLDPMGTTCGSKFNVFFFISFTLITTLLVLNVVVAVIMDNFETVNMDESDLQVGHIKMFVENWRKADPRATGKIHHSELIPLLKEVEPPFGLGKMCPKQACLHFVGKLPVPMDEEGFIRFRPTLVAIIRLRLNLWLYDFPSQDSLYQIMHHCAPDATIENIHDAVPKDSTRISGRVMSLRVFYLVIRLQNLFRSGLHVRVRKSGDTKTEFLRKSSIRASKKQKKSTANTPKQRRQAPKTTSVPASLSAVSENDALYDETEEIDLSQWAANTTVNRTAMRRASALSIQRQISVDGKFMLPPVPTAEDEQDNDGAAADAQRSSPILGSYFNPNSAPFVQMSPSMPSASADSAAAMASVLAEFGDDEGDIDPELFARSSSAPPASGTETRSAALAMVMAEFADNDVRSESVPLATTTTHNSVATSAALNAVLAEFGGEPTLPQTTHIGDYIKSSTAAVLEEWTSADVQTSAPMSQRTPVPTPIVNATNNTVTITKAPGLKLGLGLAPGGSGKGLIVKMVSPGSLADGCVKVDSVIVRINGANVIGASMLAVSGIIKSNNVLTFTFAAATAEPLSEWERSVGGDGYTL